MTAIMTDQDAFLWKVKEGGYNLGVNVEGALFDFVLDTVRVALGKEGFGVQTEMDLKRTFREKLDRELPRYIILGACSPSLAYAALTADPGIGALLPCNVMVVQEESGVFVGAIDPVRLFSVVGRKEVEPIAQQVRERLVRVLESVRQAALS